MAVTAAVFDVDAAGFADEVVARSYGVPVVVDFWAEWCGPCRTLGPVLEAAVGARGGEVVLARVDVDANQQLAQQFRVQGIPAVKAFRDGQVVAEFTGALGSAQVEAFLAGLVPSAADRATAAADAVAATDPAAARDRYEAALAIAPTHRGAALGLAELLADAEPDRAAALANEHRPDPRAEAVVTRLALAAHGGGDVEDLAAAAEAAPDDDAAWLAVGRARAAAGDHGAAIESLLRAVEVGGARREESRAQLVALFDLLGDDERVAAARPRLARALF